MLPHGYLLPQVVAVVLARPLAQRDMWGRHSRSLGDRRARLRGVQEGVFLAGGIRRAYPHVGEGRTWRGGHSAVAESLMDCTRGAAETKDVADDHNVYLVHCNVFLVTLKRQVSTVSVQESVVFDGRAFAIVNCRGGPNNTAVAVGGMRPDLLASLAAAFHTASLAVSLAR